MRDQIIQLLRNRKDYFSGEEISGRLNVSRAGIWKNIEELRKEGYSIEAVPHCGYRLVSLPDKLIAREIKNGLKTRIVGQEVVSFEKIASTMDHAFQLALEGAKEGTLVCAEQQTKGKGRLGREWISPKTSGIYASIILRPQLAVSGIAQLTLLAAVAVCRAIKRESEMDVMIKWPNDILYGNRKVAGILTEMSAETDRVRFVVVGIGINVNTPLKRLPSTATSLKAINKKKNERVLLLRAICEEVEQEYLSVKRAGFEPMIKRWKQLSQTLGSRVRISDGFGKVEGLAVDLDEWGGLMIEQDNGMIVKRMSGDVVHIKE